MSLKARKYKFQEGDSHDIFELELIPEVVDGVEVYNIQAVATDNTGIVAKSSFDNAGYPIYLSGDISIFDTNIKNEKREGKNSLTILDCFFASCDFYNISNMNNAR